MWIIVGIDFCTNRPFLYVVISSRKRSRHPLLICFTFFFLCAIVLFMIYVEIVGIDFCTNRPFLYGVIPSQIRSRHPLLIFFTFFSLCIIVLFIIYVIIVGIELCTIRPFCYDTFSSHVWGVSLRSRRSLLCKTQGLTCLRKYHSFTAVLRFQA